MRQTSGASGPQPSVVIRSADRRNPRIACTEESLVRDPLAGYRADVEHEQVSPVPGADGWSYGPFEQHSEGAALTVPLQRDDGKVAHFTVPEFVSDPEDLRGIAVIVIGALEKWEQVKGLGA